MEVTFVTSNPGKRREATSALRPFGIRVRGLSRRISEPQAPTLEDVVRAKVKATRDLAGWVLVEDSGLFVPSLNGFPGVYSSYIWGIWGGPRRFRPFLDLMSGRPRGAVFRTVAGLRQGRQVWMFRGECEGTIARRLAGRQGFGFDPVFRPKGSDRTYAQLKPEEKDALSHRGIALRKVGSFLASTARKTRSSGKK